MNPSGQRVVLVAGNPNAGKTTLFNALTGSRGRVANFPGVTVESRSASRTIDGVQVEFRDLPGAYSLTSRSPEERIAVQALLEGVEPPDAVVVVCDATSLARGLYFATQIVEAGAPVVVALSMMDEAESAKITVDVDRLSSELGARVVPVVARKGEGIEPLLAAVGKALSAEAPAPKTVGLGERAEQAIARVQAFAEEHYPKHAAHSTHLWAQWAILSSAVGGESVQLPLPVQHAVESERKAAQEDAFDLEGALIGGRYERVDAMVDACVRVGPDAPETTISDRIDSVLTHKVWGFLVFVLVMTAMFEALFSWSDPLIGVVESAIVAAQDFVTASLPDGPLRDLCVNGIIAGVGNVVVFVPQIALLFLLITALEDSGYLARVAFVIDRIMGGVGLHGKAFVPMLSGFACAIPAVMATRTLENRRDRLLTMLALPLTSCSARLPIYVLVVAIVFDTDARILSVFSVGSIALLSMYLLSVSAAVGAAAIMRRTVLRGPRPTLMLELPPYRVPALGNVLAQTYQRVKRFVVDAGTIILAFTIVLWALLSFPKDDQITRTHEQARTTAAIEVPADELDARLQEIDSQEASDHLRNSYAGRLGRGIEPALKPMGQDWRMGVGIIGAFAAREVFVSTMGIVFGIQEADEESVPLREALQSSTWPDGRPLLTPLSGIALMVFFVFACQCMSTVAAVKRESGSWKWAGFMFVYMTAFAYIAALVVFQVGSLFGWGTA